ncbi:hypothetical protein EDD21DRAFT_425813 [Dissophora ornata]|nr:hypothetical protein EDD21DRAFT_425813 [Dissophora ornata]
MWLGSSVVGLIRYEEYMKKNPLTKEDLDDFLHDKDWSILKEVAKSPERGLHIAMMIARFMGETFGLFSLPYLTYLMDKDHLSQEQAADLEKLTKAQPHTEIKPAAYKIEITDETIEQLKLKGKAEGGEMFKAIHEALLKREIPVKMIPEAQQIRPPGMLGPNSQYYVVPIFYRPEPSSLGDWSEKVASGLKELVKEKVNSYLTEEKIIRLRQDIEKKVDRALAELKLVAVGAIPKELQNEILNSGILHEAVYEVLNLILKKVQPAILDETRSLAIKENWAEGLMDPLLFNVQAAARAYEAYSTEICSVFVDRGAMLETWTEVDVVESFLAPDKEAEIVQRQEVAMKQREESFTAREEARKKYEDAQAGRTTVTKENLERLRKEKEEKEKKFNEHDKDVEAYEKRKDHTRELSKEKVKQEEAHKKRESELMKKLWEKKK